MHWYPDQRKAFLLSVLLYFLAGIPTLSAQDSIWVAWDIEEPIPKDLRSILQEKKVAVSAPHAHQVLQQLREHAYLAASIDSLYMRHDKQYHQLLIGPKFSWTSLDVSDVPAILQDALGPSAKPGSIFYYNEVLALFERLLTKAENNGYPLASVSLDSLTLQDATIGARLKVNLNNPITIEQIKVDGDLNISKNYLSYLLNVRAGDRFDRSTIKQVGSRLEEQPFIKVLSPPYVSFLGNGATLNLSLDRKAANQFDILLGLLPSPIEGRRFQLTGNVNIIMENQFGAGERFHMNFESLRPQTQELELDFSYPYVFDLPFGTELAFDLYRRDSTFIDINYELGVNYFISPKTQIQFFVKNASSRLLSIDRRRILSTKKLPESLDLSRSLLGIGFHHRNLDYRLNPRKGRQIEARLAAGSKKIKRNETILSLQDENEPDFDFAQLYSDLKLDNFQFTATVSSEFYVPLFAQSTLLLSARSGVIGGNGRLYMNELYRIGGTKLLRGFNEEALFVRAYSVFTTEYRLLFTQNSNLFLFTDLGIISQRTGDDYATDQPLGIGTGLNLETKVGIFTISYAIGKQGGDALSFRNGRIHFGMVSLF